MKALWTQPRATVTGEFWHFEKVPMEPKPVQRPYPPIWFGAREPVALRRAVRHGDGWMGAGSSSTADFVQQYSELRRLLDEAGRDPATFAISKRVYLAIDDDRDRAERRLREWFAGRYRNADMGSRVSIWGSRSECVEKLGELVRAARGICYSTRYSMNWSIWNCSRARLSRICSVVATDWMRLSNFGINGLASGMTGD